jgi:heme A synthase
MYLLGSMGLVTQAQFIGALVHKLGALIVLGALAWAAWVLKRQRARLSDAPFVEE